MFIAVIPVLQPRLQLKINAVRILCSIVKSTDRSISHQFIHGCIPSLVAKIESLTSVNSELELTYCNESFSLLEILVAMAPENSRKYYARYCSVNEYSHTPVIPVIEVINSVRTDSRNISLASTRTEHAIEITRFL